LVLLAACAGVASAGWSFGVDLSTLATQSKFACMRTASPKVDYIVVRGFRSSGTVDPNAVPNLKAAAAAGYTRAQLGVYIFPRPISNGKMNDGGAQIRTMMNALQSVGTLFSNIWLDVEGGTQFWSQTKASNVQFIQSMMTESKLWIARGYSVGIYTSSSQWAPIVSTYTGGVDFPVWYAAYNSHRDFGDWRPFAGWQTPLIHQFKGTTNNCGVSVDVNVMPDTWGSLGNAMAQYRVNGGSFVQPTPDLNPKCTAQRGTCINTATAQCTGRLASGLCSGAATVRCCIPVLQSSGPATLPTIPSTPATVPAVPSSIPAVPASVPAVPTPSQPMYPSARAYLPASTHGRIIAEAEDTGKVSWIRDEKRRFRKMRMGKLRQQAKEKAQG